MRTAAAVVWLSIGLGYVSLGAHTGNTDQMIFGALGHVVALLFSIWKELEE